MLGFNEALVAVSCVTAFFWFKMFIGNQNTRARNRKIAPEDQEAFGEYLPVDNQNKKPDDQNAPDEPDEESPLDVGGGGSEDQGTFTRSDRWNNLVNNDKENVPYALFVFWGLLIVCYIGNDKVEWLNVVAFSMSISYAVIRFIYMIFYLYGINSRPIPMRTTCHIIGQFVAATSAICLVIGCIMVAVL